MNLGHPPLVYSWHWRQPRISKLLTTLMARVFEFHALRHPRTRNQTKNPALEKHQGRGTRPLGAIALLELAPYERQSGKKKPGA